MTRLTKFFSVAVVALAASSMFAFPTKQAEAGWKGWGHRHHHHHCGPVYRPYYPVYPTYPVYQPVPVVVPQPVVTVQAAPVTPPKPMSADEQARVHVLAARKAFEQRQFPTALALMNQAVAIVPKNADAHQFRSLILFSMEKYEPAADEMYQALLLGPMWNYKTIADLYKNDDDYAAQYQKLQAAAASDPASLQKHFLLATHHLMLGHIEAGEKELTTTLALKPNEPVVTKLLAVVQSMKTSPDAKMAQTK